MRTHVAGRIEHFVEHVVQLVAREQTNGFVAY